MQQGQDSGIQMRATIKLVFNWKCFSMESHKFSIRNVYDELMENINHSLFYTKNFVNIKKIHQR